MFIIYDNGMRINNISLHKNENNTSFGNLRLYPQTAENLAKSIPTEEFKDFMQSMLNLGNKKLNLKKILDYNHRSLEWQTAADSFFSQIGPQETEDFTVFFRLKPQTREPLTQPTFEKSLKQRLYSLGSYLCHEVSYIFLEINKTKGGLRWHHKAETLWDYPRVSFIFDNKSRTTGHFILDSDITDWNFPHGKINNFDLKRQFPWYRNEDGNLIYISSNAPNKNYLDNFVPDFSNKEYTLVTKENYLLCPTIEKVETVIKNYFEPRFDKEVQKLQEKQNRVYKNAQKVLAEYNKKQKTTNTEEENLKMLNKYYNFFNN